MNNNSCVIHRQEISDKCKMQAAYLSKLIYKRPLGTPAPGQKPKPFDTSWPEEIARAERNWEEVEDFDEQEENGFVARFYKPKGYNFNAENGDAMCWPTLVFRGTDFEDFHGLGFSARVRIDALADLIKDIKTRGMTEAIEMLQDMEAASYGTFPLVRPTQRDREKNIEDNIKRAQEAEKQAARDKKVPQAENADKVLVDTTIIMDADFLKNYNYDHKAYNRKDAEAAGFKPREDLIRIPKIEGDLKLSEEFSGRAEIKAELLGNMQGRTGDWMHNLLQGVGNIEESAQYKRAIEVTDEITEKYIKNSTSKRLTITGHSLGGGLATAADFTARYNYYKDNIQIYTIVFNPAGLHENTIRFIKDTSTYAQDVKQAHEEALRRVNEDDEAFDKRVAETLRRNKEQAKLCISEPRLSDAAFNVYRVAGDILTTLEYIPDQIPFLTGVMGILGMKFPKPQGADNVMRALSPGLNQAQEKAYAEALQVVARTGGMYIPPEIRDSFPPSKKYTKLPILFPLTEQTAIEGQKFTHILALSAIFAKYGKDIGRGDATSFSACLNEMVDYIDGAFFDGRLRRYINSQGENRSVFSLLTWKAIKEYFGGEFDDLKKLMALANEYHGMDYVIASLEDKLAREERGRRNQEAREWNRQYQEWLDKEQAERQRHAREIRERDRQEKEAGIHLEMERKRRQQRHQEDMEWRRRYQELLDKDEAERRRHLQEMRQQE